MKMKKKSPSMKYVDAMAVKDGYIATPVKMEEFCCETNAKYGKKPGPYQMEMEDMDAEDESEMD